MIWVGTCGFEGRRVDAYPRVRAVEVQETFYHPVRAELAARWRIESPDDFRFAVKASQFITHPASSPTYRRAGRAIAETERSAYGSFQASTAVKEGWDATLAVAAALRAEVIVFQTPASFGPSEGHIANLYRFFESIRTHVVKAWEPRGPWAGHVVAKVCEDLGLVHAVDPFASEPETYGLAYFRLHGSPPGPTMYRYTYTDADLARLRAMSGEYDDAYVMFNNLAMAADAARFRALVELAPGE